MPRHTVRCTRSLLATLLLLGSLAGSLPAQQGADTLSPHRSGTTALLFSLVPTLLGALPRSHTDARDHVAGGLLFASAVLGPALGHFYAGNPGRGFTGIGIRAGILAGATVMYSTVCTREDNLGCGIAVVGVAGAGALVSMIVDIAAAPGSANRFNTAHAELAIVPLQGAEHPRVGVGMKFVF